MTATAKNILRAIYEGKWLDIDYKNKLDKISHFWIGISDIEFQGGECKISCSGLELKGNYSLTDNMTLYFEKIIQAQIIDGTYLSQNKNLVFKIENSAQFSKLFSGVANLKILDYLADCKKMEGVPSLVKDSILVSAIDDGSLQDKPYKLNYEQFSQLVRAFLKKTKSENDKTQNISQLCINKLSLHTQKGLYILAYREISFDVKNRVLVPSEKISFNKEFCVSGNEKEKMSVANFLDADEICLLDDFDKNIFEIEDIIQSRIRKEQIDDTPRFLQMQRHLNVNLQNEFESITQMAENGALSIPLKAFFGELISSQKNDGQIAIVLANRKVNLDQLLAIHNAFAFPVSYIQGPPGTGKTNTIVNTIVTAFFNGKTVLFSSHNNHPVDGVFKALTSLEYKRANGQTCEIPFPILRLGNSDKVKEAMCYIQNLYERTKNEKIYSGTLLSDKNKKIENSKKLGELLKLHEEAVELDERKDALETMISKTDNMEMQLSLSGQQLSEIKKRRDEIPKITDEDALKLLDDDEVGFKKYLYFVSASYIKRLGGEEFSALREILKISDEDERASEFNKWTSVDENLFLLQKIFPVIATTCISARNLGSARANFDMSIIDEASQCDTVTALISVVRGKSLELVGDTQQLNPVITLDKNINDALKKKYAVSDDYDYIENSVYKTFLANDAVSDEILLHNHYRCEKEIIGFSNKKYYNNQLIVLSQKKEEEPLVFCDVQENPAEIKNTSEAEAKEIAGYIKNHPNENIGIITPFRNQKEQIDCALKEARLENYQCGTVHAFQGDEKDTILFSLALTNKTRAKTYEWLKNNRELINVATSRAKEKLVIFSNEKTIETLHKNSLSEIDQNKNRDDIYELFQYVKQNGKSKVSNIENNSRALGTKPYKTETENAFFETLNHALSTIISPGEKSKSNEKYKVETQVQASHLFEAYDWEKEIADYFYRCSFDFVIYKIGLRGKETPELAIELNGREHYIDERVKKRDEMKRKICEKHNFTLVSVENSYARRYNFIKQILLDYFKR